MNTEEQQPEDQRGIIAKIVSSFVPLIALSIVAYAVAGWFGVLVICVGVISAELYLRS